MSKPANPFRYFNSSPEVIRLVPMMYTRFPLSLRNVEDLLFERGSTFAARGATVIDAFRFAVRKRHPQVACVSHARLASMAVAPGRNAREIGGQMPHLWRAVDHEGQVLESFATKVRDKAAALRFMKKAIKRYGKPEMVVTDGLRSCGAAMTEMGNAQEQVGRWLNNRVENSHLAFRR